ncbi:MAG: FAD-dependent oxidoreductase, partial [Gaiellaceae bacterium]
MRVAEADVAVVGVGVMGAATTWALASDGLDVVALEQFRLGHARGSSHGTSRIFRLSYDDAGYVRLAQEALALWRELEADAAETVLEQTGSLDIGDDLSGFRTALTEAGVPFERPSPDELRREFPLLRPPDREFLLQRDGGTVHAERAVRAFVRVGQARGARVAEGTPVSRLEPDGDGVTIETAAGSLRVRAAVLTAGAWA